MMSFAAYSLVIEVVEVSRDKDVDVAHDLEDVEALLQGLRRQSVVHSLEAGKLGIRISICDLSFINLFILRNYR